MRTFAVIILVAFGFMACRGVQPTPPSPAATSHVRKAPIGIECALWGGMPEEERRLAALGVIEGALHQKGSAWSSNTETSTQARQPPSRLAEGAAQQGVAADELVAAASPSL